MAETRHISDIGFTSCVFEAEEGKFEAVVRVEVTGDKGERFQSDLETGHIREIALTMLKAAEAADQDRVVMTILIRDRRMPRRVAASFIKAMRIERGDYEEDEKDEGSDSPDPEAAAQNGEAQLPDYGTHAAFGRPSLCFLLLREVPEKGNMG